MFLADEISLADDSVLERMNSVLEPEREILLAEKIGQEMEAEPGLTTEVVKARESFRFVGTMNPGGDYGKKELSPALRNRFTEVWCPSLTSPEDLANIISRNLTDESLTSSIVTFVSWLRDNSGAVVSIRDVLAWTTFINTITANGLQSGGGSDRGSSLGVAGRTPAGGRNGEKLSSRDTGGSQGEAADTYQHRVRQLQTGAGRDRDSDKSRAVLY